MDTYKTVISAANSILKDYGFKKGTIFCLTKDENWGLIGFQKSQNSTKDYIRFTINIGVSSGALRHYVDDDLSQKPIIEKSHWQTRIGSLMPGFQDHWWELNQNETDEYVIFDVVKKLKNLVIPTIEEHISDNGLINVWKNGKDDGTTLYKKYVYLTTLLKLNNSEELSHYIEEFIEISEGKPFKMDAIRHIMELEKITGD